MAERILELDVFAPKPDRIMYRGTSYEVRPVQVAPLLAILRDVQDLQDLSAGTPSAESVAAMEKALAAILAMVGDNIPGLPVKELSINELRAVINFMVESAKGNDHVEAAAGEQGEQSPEKKTNEPQNASATTSPA